MLIRWVARRTGTVDALQLQVKVTGRGYAAGAGGVLQATTYPVLANGRPNISAPLATDRFPTRSRERGGAVAVRLDLPVNAGDQFATVVRNDAERPSRDFFSANFLYAKNGVRGANGRNELSVSAGDRYYGLDARELVGYSRDGGDTWLLPGGPYGSNGGTDFLPTYVQQYSNGVALGQYYYYAHRVSGPVRMVYPHAPRTTITHIAAYTGNEGSRNGRSRGERTPARGRSAERHRLPRPPRQPCLCTGGCHRDADHPGRAGRALALTAVRRFPLGSPGRPRPRTRLVSRRRPRSRGAALPAARLGHLLTGAPVVTVLGARPQRGEAH